MCYQTLLLIVCLITNITNIRALTTMYALMSCQSPLFTEFLITHITSIMALTTMCAFMCYQTPLLTEHLITHFTSIRTLITMDALMCYQTPLMTVCPITHFTCVLMLTPMYITGISAFSTVYMKLFIRSSLVKTQRSNIRIYSDTKNSYFYSNVHSK
jgi:hypothetical protein